MRRPTFAWQISCLSSNLCASTIFSRPSEHSGCPHGHIIPDPRSNYQLLYSFHGNRNRRCYHLSSLLGLGVNNEWMNALRVLDFQGRQVGQVVFSMFPSPEMGRECWLVGRRLLPLTGSSLDTLDDE
ncbi:hypothetical protein IW261DRAFT_509267 [Armillaria novae-zelandiae]|uniref:Uncharacterized protein n=1 Tax=Armillaria novae-zelandiae TaxID=153914 RepID=A0AA39U696_9AGAR|nr:hypothetical protein IW261DRAFT_509267 [Armillaria novae-zelandiae]